VPFVIHDSQYHGEYHLAPPPEAGLSNVASTLFDLLGFVPPVESEPSLIQFD
jgi:hypothetical protein